MTGDLFPENSENGSVPDQFLPRGSLEKEKRSNSREKQKQIDTPLHNLMVRYTLLACLALVSTFVFLLFVGIVGSASIIAFDVVVKFFSLHFLISKKRQSKNKCIID